MKKKHQNKRLVIGSILATAMMVAAFPAQAQTYDPNYPVCIHTYSIGGGYVDCSFTSLPQCAATAAGRSAECLVNPYFASSHEAPRAFAYRRHR